MPFWKDNRSDGTMTPFWRDPDPFPRVALALTVGQSAAKVIFPCHQKPLLTKQLWSTHNVQIEHGREKKKKVKQAKATFSRKVITTTWKKKMGQDIAANTWREGGSEGAREGGRGKAENGLV